MSRATPVDRRTSDHPHVLLGVVAPIPSIGAEPGDLIFIRRGARRPVVLQREVLEGHGMSQLGQAVGRGTARILDDSDPITMAMLKPSPTERAPLRLIRGGAR